MSLAFLRPVTYVSEKTALNFPGFLCLFWVPYAWCLKGACANDTLVDLVCCFFFLAWSVDWAMGERSYRLALEE